MGMTNEEEVILALKELKDWKGLPYCIEEPMQNEGIAVITKEALDMAIKALEQQSSEDCISRAYIESIVEELENICINGDDYILSLLSDIKNAPSVTPKTSCESCREQVLKHLEKEDWADTVNCVMNMPFINKPCVSEGVCREDKTQVLDKIRTEIMQLDYDLESVDYDYNDMVHTETIHMICREEVLQILDKYKAESEE